MGDRPTTSASEFSEPPPAATLDTPSVDRSVAEVLRSASVRQTCSACPSQWEGFTGDGRAVYVRFRHGHLTVGFGENEGDAVDNSAGWNGRPPAFAGQVGTEWDGQIGWYGAIRAIEKAEATAPDRSKLQADEDGASGDGELAKGAKATKGSRP